MSLALSIKSLEKRYASGAVALKGIDLQVNKGEFFGLLGPNGAGKTTTIGIVTGIVNKSAGSVHIFSHDLDKDFEAAKSCMGVVPQELNISIFDKVLDVLVNQAGYYGVPRSTALLRAEYYLKRLDLWEKRDQPSRALSGGMKRRLMIARALVHEPSLLILDEPTAGVDVELRHSTWGFLQELNKKGVTIILTTHYLEEAEQLCDKLAIIHKGAIIENTSKKELLRKVETQTYVCDLTRPLTKKKIPGIRVIDESTIEVDVRKGETLNTVFVTLARHKLSVQSLHAKSNRLEQLFLEKTGDVR